MIKYKLYIYLTNKKEKKTGFFLLNNLFDDNNSKITDGDHQLEVSLISFEIETK